MPNEMHKLQIALDVASSPEVLTIEKDVPTLEEVRKLVDDFLAQYGRPDSGIQAIGITITSRMLD